MGKECDMDIPFRTEHATVSFPVHIYQLRLSIVSSVSHTSCCKRHGDFGQGQQQAASARSGAEKERRRMQGHSYRVRGTPRTKSGPEGLQRSRRPL